MKNLSLHLKFVILFVAGLLIYSNSFSQSDHDENTVNNVKDMHGITQQEAANLKSQVNIERNIPQSLLYQLETARQNGDYELATSIQEQIDTQYGNGTYPGVNQQTDMTPLLSGAPYNPDWLGTDIEVYNGAGANRQRRTLDMKMGPDGYMYLATIIDGGNRIRVFRSTDNGVTWAQSGGVVSSKFYGTISMVVNKRNSSNLDSVRVIVYFTVADANNNNDAKVGFFSYKPNVVSGDYIVTTFATPTAGNEFNYVSAISDGQFFSNNVRQGVAFGEYTNNGTSAVSIRYYRTSNWGTSHTGVTFNTGQEDFFPTAAFKPVSGAADSVYIAVEREISGDKLIRIIRTPFFPTASSSTLFLTPTGFQYERPVINMQQTAQTITDKNMIITYTKDGIGKYAYSINGGSSWFLDANLEGSGDGSTNYTWVSSDTTTDGNKYFLAVYCNNDSLSVRRGRPGSLGATLAMANSNRVTSTAPPVCAIFNDGMNMSSTFAYWGFGGFGTNVYYNGENIIAGIQNLTQTADDYKLSQNYPNPFNPTTNINFSIPKAGQVKIVVYDVLGQEVATLVNEVKTTGTYKVDFDASGLTSGIYFYKLEANGFSDIKKMMLVK